MLCLYDCLVESPVSKPNFHLTRRRFLELAGLSVVGLGLYAGEISRHEIDIEQHTIKLTRLPEAFRGLKVVQISDIHYADYTEPFFVRWVVEEVNRLKPDVVMLTGDFISYGPSSRKRQTIQFAYHCAEILRGIQCPQRFAVMGNHDCIVSCEGVTDAITTAGIPVLNNSAIPLERDGKRLWIAGLADPLIADPRPDLAIPKASLKDGEPVILLAHEPDYVGHVVPYGVDLMLSGHTHGGQVRIPFLPAMFLPKMGTEHVEGLFHLGKTQLYVNRGIGSVGVPFRFRCPPEITEFTLV